MAKVAVKYTATFVQVIDWPDDELVDFNHDNLLANIDPEKSQFTGDIDVDDVELNGEEHYF